MLTKHDYWTIEKLVKNYNDIEFPEFQREPIVWTLDKKQKLIDSILRDFDISTIYFYVKEEGGYDCIDGRQRINSIMSYLGLNEEDTDYNKFHLSIENEIFDDGDKYQKIRTLRFESLDETWQKKILNYPLNIVFITDINDDLELNLLFLRLQIASVLNAGEKLNAMTGDMRNWIFTSINKHKFFDEISIPKRRFAKEQIAAQIAINAFYKNSENDFHRSRYVDLQEFFKKNSRFDEKTKKLTTEIRKNLDIIYNNFEDQLAIIKNRALAVSIYLFISELIIDNQETDIPIFVKFFTEFLKTYHWQIPKGLDMDREYKDLFKFQSYITQAAGEKTAISERHKFLKDYFCDYKNQGIIKGDKEYKEKHNKDPKKGRENIVL
ncbi:DUF262 domain-containing protein [candidate division KSB1 bacterium]